MQRRNSRLALMAGGAVLAAAGWLGGRATWLAAHDPVDFAAHRRETLDRLGAEREHARAALAEINQRRGAVAAELAATQERARAAERALAGLKADASWWRDAWQKVFGDADAVHTREERMARLEAARTIARDREPELRTTLTRITWERDGAEIALARAERQWAAIERDRSAALHYLAAAWRLDRWWVVGAMAVWLAGLALWRSRHP